MQRRSSTTMVGPQLQRRTVAGCTQQCASSVRLWNPSASRGVTVPAVKRAVATPLPHMNLLYLGTQRRSFHCSFHEPITAELITIESMELSSTPLPDEAGRDADAPSNSGSGGSPVASCFTFVVETADVIIDANRTAQRTHNKAAPQPQPRSGRDVDHTTPTDCSNRNYGNTGPTTAMKASPRQTYVASEYTVVHAVDTYAKGKIVNFLRRMGSTATSLFDVSRETVELSHSGNASTTTVHRAKVKLTLPSPHLGMFVGEGVAETEKDAEHLAAMHAEHIIDALGVPLFRLPSMQIKHAEAARRQRRYSPMPGDAIRPEGTAVPLPFCMSQLIQVTEQSYQAGTVVGDATETEEAISPPSSPNAASVTLESPSQTSSAASMGTDAVIMDQPPQPLHPYASCCYFPWASPQVPPAAATMTTSSSSTFDATENGQFQLVSTTSARMSASDDAVQFPFIFDKSGAYERLKDFFLAHGVDIKKRITTSHVAVPGFSARMHLAEVILTLPDHSAAAALHGASVIASLKDKPPLIGRGKAVERDVAIQLAAMHAELLIDAVGLRLFPRDDARQAAHSETVRGYARWARHPSHPLEPIPPCGISSTRQFPVHQVSPAGLQSVQAYGYAAAAAGGHDAASQAVPLPIALKQQIGADDMGGIDTTQQGAMQRRFRRSLGERVTAANVDLGNSVNELIEVNPPVALLKLSRSMIRQWQLCIAHNPMYDSYVITRLGDYYRATLLLPVPRELGIRGGTGIGRSVEQAKDLAALHAIDTLIVLGLPISDSGEDIKNMLEARAAAGTSVITNEIAAAFGYGVRCEGCSVSGGGLAGKGWWAKGNRDDDDEVVSQPSSPASSTLTTNSSASTRTVVKYLPGYIIEGASQRPLHRAEDLLFALSLKPDTDFEEVTGRSDEEVIAWGNDTRANLAMFFQRAQSAWKRSTHCGSSIGLLAANLRMETTVTITGYSRNMSVYNIAIMRVPLMPPSKNSDLTTATATVLAIGIAPKKKDAERMCFLHAGALLQYHGIDLTKEKEVSMIEKKLKSTSPQSNGSYVKKSTSPPSTSTNTGANVDDTSGLSNAAAAAPTSSSPPPPPKPFLHYMYRQNLANMTKLQNTVQIRQQRRRGFF